jgi:hypothetical protein
MDRSKYLSAILKAPMGGFLVLFICLFFEIVVSSRSDKFEALLGSSFLMLVYIYMFYMIGLILIIPIVWGLHHWGKLNSITSMIGGGLFGCLAAGMVSGIFEYGNYLCPLMGVASGYILWSSWPKVPPNSSLG